MSDSKLDQVLRDGEGVLQSVLSASRPPCHLCGQEQTRWYIDLRYTEAGRLAVCIPCANSRYEGEGQKWTNPDKPGERSTNIHIGRYKSVEPDSPLDIMIDPNSDKVIIPGPPRW